MADEDKQAKLLKDILAALQAQLDVQRKISNIEDERNNGAYRHLKTLQELNNEVSSLKESEKQVYETLKDQTEEKIAQSAADDKIVQLAYRKKELEADFLKQKEKINEASKLLERLGAAGVDKAAAGYYLATNQLSVLQGMVQEQGRLQNISAAEKGPTKLKLAAEEQLAKLKERHKRVAELSSTAEGRAQLAAEKSQSTNVSKLVTSQSILGTIARQSKALVALGDAEEEAAKNGKQLGGWQMAGAAGIQGLVSAIGKIAPALTTAATGMDLVGSVIMAVIAAFDEVNKVGSRSMQALEQQTKTSFDGIYSALTPGRAAANQIREAAGLSVPQYLLIREEFKKMRDTAQTTMMGFFAPGADTIRGVNEWTGGIVAAQIAGTAFGRTYEESAKKFREIGKAFNRSKDETLSYYKTTLTAARAAGLAYEDFDSVVGSAIDNAEKFGAVGATAWKSWSAVLGNISNENRTKMLIGKGVSAMMNKPLTVLGFASRYLGGTSEGIAAMRQAYGTGTPLGPMGLTASVMSSFAQEKTIFNRETGEYISALEAARSPNAELYQQGAARLATVFTGNAGNLFRVGQEDMLRGIEALSDKTLTPENRYKAEKDLARNLEDMDMESKGVRSIQQQVGILQKIESAVEGILEATVQLATASTFLSTGVSAEEKASLRKTLADVKRKDEEPEMR